MPNQRKSKRIIATLPVVLIVVVLGFTVFSFFSPTPYMPTPRNLQDESAFNLDEKVGWYVSDDSVYHMITWGAVNGLRLNRFDKIGRSDLKPVTADVFTWELGKNKPSYRVEFQRDSDGRITGMQWNDGQGQRRSAARVDFGYRQAEVRFLNGDVELAGLLMTPLSAGPHPAIVFIHGSGVSDRNNYWYIYQADFFAKRGFVVLLPDKRGCGKSGGEWHVASFDDFAGDALAAIRYLKQIEMVDSSRIGLIGCSQGGWIAPLTANKTNDVRFIISESGSATTPSEQLRHEITADIRNSGVPGSMASSMAPMFIERAKKKRPTWWAKNGDFDPIVHWRRLSIPVLIAYGKKDENDNVPVEESLARLEQAKSENQNANFTIKVYEDSGHSLEDPKTGWIRADFLELLIDWIRKTTR